MNKKILIGILALIAAIVIITVLVLLINSNQQDVLSDGMVLDSETCQLIENISNNNVIVLHQTGCPHCAVALSELHEIEQEKNVTFAYYDLIIESERKEVMDQMGLLPPGVPTTIINCNVQVGVRSKQQYFDLIFPN